jgi:GNAT superfamily N-acetyltransferase
VETARAATGADLADLERLWRGAVDELDGQRGGSALAGSLERADLPGYLAGALGEMDRLLVLGFIDQSAVGLASLYADRRPRRPVGQLELIYVEPQARQIGVAEAMLEVAVASCRDWGMSGIDAPALPGNRGAKSFFEIHGFQARMLVMHRRLEEP